MFLTLMLISWTSASNSAEIFNTCLARPEWQPQDWPFEFDLRGEHIWNAISHLAILEDCELEGRILVLPHGSVHKDRLAGVIAERNRRFHEQGQPEWGHYCDKCIRYFYDENGQPTYYARGSLSDGLTIGHRCCNVPHCVQPLASKRDRYCPGHRWQESLCSVDECQAKVISNGMTCGDPEHVELYELWMKGKGANFQRKQTMKSAASKPMDNEAMEQAEESDDIEIEVEVDVCPQKPESGIRKLRARFGCRQTASEQFIVRPCGVVVGRATFYGSETVPQTVALLKQVFRTPGSMPEYFFYNNCCGVYNHLHAQGDPLLVEVGFPVDAFHFDCKHKKTDTTCQEHCNPRRFPELLNPDGSLFFNSSKCEQLNAWLGGFRAIFREMNADRYNFLLDELLMRKNRLTIAKLKRNGQAPSRFPGLKYCM